MAFVLKMHRLAYFGETGPQRGTKEETQSTKGKLKNIPADKLWGRHRKRGGTFRSLCSQVLWVLEVIAELNMAVCLWPDVDFDSYQR